MFMYHLVVVWEKELQRTTRAVISTTATVDSGPALHLCNLNHNNDDYPGLNLSSYFGGEVGQGGFR